MKTTIILGLIIITLLGLRINYLLNNIEANKIKIANALKNN